MRFESTRLGERLIRELKSARRASIAVAYFNPDSVTLEVLKTVPKLKLVVSDNFEINDPHKLEKLKNTGPLHFVASEGDAGKLHAKVFIVHRKNGSRWIMVGSANLTGAGLLDNQEACICLDSTDAKESHIVDGIEAWFDQIFEQSRKIDFEIAKRIFAARSKYRLQPRETASQQTIKSVEARGYWALKTTEGSYGISHWQEFQAENVVAIGWPDVDVDPARVSDEELRKAVQRSYRKGSPRAASRIAGKIRSFVEMQENDLVLICRGYPPGSRVDVHVYGIARVIGPFLYDEGSSWWCFKHAAAIQVIDQKIPRSTLASAIERDSLRETIHKLSPRPFKHAMKVFADHFGFRLAI